MSTVNIKASNLGLAQVASSGSYNDLLNAPNVTAASATDIPFSTTSTLSSTNVQGAIAELTNKSVLISTKGVVNGVATLDGSGQVPLSQLGNAPASSGSSAAATANPSPTTHNFLGWTIDPVHAGANFSPNLGTVSLYKISWPVTATVSTVDFIVYQGTSLANCYVGIYSSSGTLLAQSADQSSVWNSSGADRSISLMSSVSITGSATTYIYVGYLIGSGTVNNIMLRTLTNAFVSTNMGLTTANARAINIGSSLTSLPSSVTLTSGTLQQYIVPIGVK